MKLKPPSLPLENARREIFCQQVSLGVTNADAYINAGYSVKTTHKARVMRNYEDVSARIEYLLGKKAAEVAEKNKTVYEELGLSKKWVLEKLMETYSMSIAGEPIIDKDGNSAGNKQNLAAANKALELIGKEMGMFTIKIESDKEDPIMNLIRSVQNHALLVAREREVYEAIEDKDGY